MDENEKIFRRIFHSMTWIVLVYYLVPDTLFGYSKRLWLLFVLAVVLVFEAFRIFLGFQVPGMRVYEKRQIASYAWAAIAAAVTLFFFPMHLAFVALLGMGVVDPMIGELQVHFPKYYPYLPLISWIGLASLILILMTSYSLLSVISLSIVGGIVAIIAEYPSIMIDDDLLMVLTPLFVLRGLEIVFIS